MTPRQYRLFLTRPQKFALILPIAMFIIMPIIFFIAFTYGTPSNSPRPNDLSPYFPWFPFAFFFLVPAYLGWHLSSMPFEITVTHDKQLVFRSLLHSRTVRPSDVMRIEPKMNRLNVGMSGYQLTHLNGKIRYPGQFTEMYLLLAELKQANPSVEITGC